MMHSRDAASNNKYRNFRAPLSMSPPSLHHLDCAGPAGAHRLGYWAWGAADAPHLVVCVHGLTRQGRDFDVLAQALVERSTHPLRVVCPDIVGRGQSEWLVDKQILDVVGDSGESAFDG